MEDLRKTTVTATAEAEENEVMEDMDAMVDVVIDEEPTDAEMIQDEKEVEELLKEDVDVDMIAGELKTIDSLPQYMHDIGKYNLLSKEEETELAKRAKAGDKDARDAMICANLRLVVNIAKKKSIRGGELEDIIQEGNEGLMRAVDKFDPDKGFRLTTYAYWWINQNIDRYFADNGRHIRIPVHMQERLTYYLKNVEILKDALKRDPTNEEVITATDGKLTNEMIVQLEDIIRQSKRVSLDSSYGSDGDTSMGEIIGDTGDESATDYVRKKEREEVIQEVLGDFKPIQRRVICLRYGLDDGIERTLEETAQELFKEGFKNKDGDVVTREWVRQIEANVLDKIKKSTKKMAKLRALL